MAEAVAHPRIVSGLEDLDGAALAEFFRLDGDGPCWSNRTSLLNIGGPMLGGHIAAIGAKAAALSAERAMPSALHILFASAPDPSRCCAIGVEALRNGRRFAHRLVRISQEGRLRAQVTATLCRPDLADQPLRFEHSEPAPAAPEPENLPTRADLRASTPFPPASIDALILSGHPFLDIRYVPQRSHDNGKAKFWVRAPGAAGLDALDHVCMMALISDYWCTLPVHHLPGIKAALGPDITTTSLDHALWYHRQPDCADWMLFEVHAPAVSEGIAAMEARAWDRQGQVLASCLQHALVVRRSGTGAT